jgi:hypothetical protein
MSIRTEENLQDALAADMIWRKREITTIRWLLSKATIDKRGPLLRSAVALVYAHWEGFIKTASSAYLEFLHYRRLTYAQFSPNFIALAAKPMLRQTGLSNRFDGYIEVTQFFLTGLLQPCRFAYKDGIETRSNLSSELLKNITLTLGLDYKPFETKTHLIDERLLRTRNTVAHGEYLILDEDSVIELAEEVISLLEAFRSQIDNAVALGTYRASVPPSLPAPAPPA